MLVAWKVERKKGESLTMHHSIRSGWTRGRKGFWIANFLISMLAAICLNKIYLHFFAAFGADRLSLERTCVFFAILCFACLHFVFRAQDIYNFIYCHRFKLALAVFILCTALQLHGSTSSRASLQTCFSLNPEWVFHTLLDHS